jgi:hypothetical protein
MELSQYLWSRVVSDQRYNLFSSKQLRNSHTALIYGVHLSPNIHNYFHN